MNQDLRGWAEVHVSHLTSNELTTQEVNVRLMRRKGVLVNLTCRQDTSKQGLASPCHSLCYICPTLFLQSLSEQAKCASPSKRKGNALRNQIAQVEPSTEQGCSTGLRARWGRGRQTKCCSQGILRQLTDDRTPLVHHTLTQSAIEKTTATPLRAYEEPEALGNWGWGGPELAILQTASSPSTSKESSGMLKRLDQAVPRPGSDRLSDDEVETNFIFIQFRRVRPAKEKWTPLERGSPAVPASLLTGMYQEWKVVEHKWRRKWPKTPTPDPMLSKIR